MPGTVRLDLLLIASIWLLMTVRIAACAHGGRVGRRHNGQLAKVLGAQSGRNGLLGLAQSARASA